MKRIALLALAALIGLAAPAVAQVNPQNMPASTVYGRLGIGAGPGQAIPFSALIANIGTPLVAGQPPTVVGHIPLWNNTAGTLLSDSGFTTGTSGHAIPFLDGINVFSTTQVIPTIAGGTAAGSSVTLESTSNGSPSGDVANVLGATINLRTVNNSGSGVVNCGNANATSCAFSIAGSASGAVTLQGSTGTYNFNLPTAAGTSGFPLLSGGGGSTAQTYGQLGNAALANMAAWTFKGNSTSGSATPTDVTIDGLTAKGSPAAGDEVMIWDVAGAAWKKATVSSIGSAGSVSSIAGNTGAFTLGGLLTNSTNLLQVVAAVKSDQQTGTSTTLAVTPDHQQDHDSAIKAWVAFTGSTGAIQGTAYNVSSVSRSAAGTYTVNFTTAFANTNYSCRMSTESTGGASGIYSTITSGSRATGSVGITTLNTSAGNADPATQFVECTGRQ